MNQPEDMPNEPPCPDVLASIGDIIEEMGLDRRLVSNSEAYVISLLRTWAMLVNLCAAFLVKEFPQVFEVGKPFRSRRDVAKGWHFLLEIADQDEADQTPTNARIERRMKL